MGKSSFDGLLMELTPNIVFIVDPDHVISDLSKAAAEYLGFASPSELVGKRAEEVVTDPVLVRYLQGWFARLGKGFEVEEVFPLVDPKTDFFGWYNLRAYPLARDGVSLGYAFFLSDLTGLYSNKTILNTLVSSLPGETLVFSQAQRIILSSDRLARRNGFASYGELTGKSLADLPQFDHDALQGMLAELGAGDGPVIKTTKEESPSGEIRWFRSDLRPIRSAGGTFSYILTRFNVTEEIKPRAILESLMDSASELITVVTPDNRIEYASLRLAKQLGFSSWRVLAGKPWRHLFSKMGAQKEAFERLFEHGGFETGSKLLRVEWPDGPAHLDCRIDSLTFEGEPFGRFGIAVDMTEVVAAREQAESALRVKAAFLANMTHELRTPMNAVLGMNELLSRTELSPVQRNYAEQIRASASLLLSIIGDILDFSRIEAGKLVFSEAPYRTESLLRDVVNLIGVKAHEKGLSFTVDLDPFVPATLVGDEIRVKQVLINLLNNAVKFTPKGEVSLVISPVADRDASRAILRVSVRDTGVGIPRDRQARLFEEFSRIDDGANRAVEGTGLGLSICKGLVTMMGGDLTVESEEGAGSTFAATIRQGVPAGTPPVANLTAFRGVRLAVFERDAAVRASLVRMARYAGIEPELFDSPDALAAAVSESPTPPTHVIFEYANAYAGIQRLVASRPGVAWLSLLTLSDFLGGGKDPAVSFVFKPLLVTSFARFLAGEYVDFTATLPLAGTLGGPVVPFRARGVTALVVDDNAVNRKVAEGFLKSVDISVVEAESGAEAVVLATKRPEPFDVVLLDQIMPGMDGVETAQRLRSLEGYARVPILAFTASADGQSLERFRAAGIDDVIPKPVELAPFLVCVRKWIQGERVSDAVAAEAGAEAGKGRVNWIPGFDHEAALRYTGGEKNLGAILALFEKTAPKLLEKIESGRRSGDPAAFRASAHALVGSCANVGAMELSRLARALEDAILAGDPDAQDRLYPLVHAELRAAIAGVAGYLKENG